MSFGSVSGPGGRTHSVLYCRSKVRSLRGRFGSHTMITREPPRPPVSVVAFGAAPLKLYVKFDLLPLRKVEIPDNCQPSNTPLAITLSPMNRLAPGTIQL